MLGTSSLFHLLLDSLEIKWDNGVNVLAPLDWRLEQIGFFWPESLAIHFLTGFGLVYSSTKWPETIKARADLEWSTRYRVIRTAAVLIIAYLASPAAMLQGPLSVNSHYVPTLSGGGSRTGSSIELDRARYLPDASVARVVTFAGEALEVKGIELDAPGTVSVRGVFISESAVQVNDYHVRAEHVWDIASYLGLGLVAS